MKKYISIFLSLLIIFSLAGCGNSKPADNMGGFSIVTTIFPYYDFARQITKYKADVTMLLSPGGESHDYEPSPQDIIKINNADIFIYNGGESDYWVETILDSIDSDVTVIKMFDYVTPLCAENDHEHQHHDESKEEHHHVFDEHIWTSPVNAIKFIDIIAREIINCDDSNESFYRKNAKLYVEKLKNLDKDLYELFHDNEEITMVVADRFPMLYFTERYGVEYKSLFPGCSSETQPSIAAVTEMIDFVNNNNIPVVFHMDTTNEKIARLIAEDTGAKIDTLFSCHNVTKEQFENGETYLSLMELNLYALMEAF